MCLFLYLSFINLLNSRNYYIIDCRDIECVKEHFEYKSFSVFIFYFLIMFNNNVYIGTTDFLLNSFIYGPIY
jgi:hypothetical protein